MNLRNEERVELSNIIQNYVNEKGWYDSYLISYFSLAIVGQFLDEPEGDKSLHETCEAMKERFKKEKGK